jgi:glutamine synthetase
LDVLIVDLQGNVRGKRVPGDQIAKALDGNVRLPLSTQLLDIWGDDIDHITRRGLSKNVWCTALHMMKV